MIVRPNPHRHVTFSISGGDIFFLHHLGMMKWWNLREGVRVVSNNGVAAGDPGLAAGGNLSGSGGSLQVPFITEPAGVWEICSRYKFWSVFSGEEREIDGVAIAGKHPRSKHWP
ncbi:hypothetical protein NE237_027865 [Protea cynaroides]|uniref:Uncharacterized protein n=1 Tax=Protea cynaroides TaxID=273540 RepID=A0A9Q0JUS1_9MAGN|nr:hypothetical protein NE237_027865 [Protea cynaroides]